MPGLEKNRIYRAHIDGYSSEGLGIARIDGQVVFVHGAIRGEVCDVLVMKVLKNAAFGKIAALVEPSPVPMDAWVQDTFPFALHMFLPFRFWAILPAATPLS